MEFDAFITALQVVVVKAYPDAEFQRQGATAEWSRVDRAYMVSLTDRGDGTSLVTYAIGGGGEELGIVPLDGAGVEEAAAYANTVLYSARFHHLTGQYAPDSTVRDMGSAWSYTDSVGRHVTGTRHNPVLMTHLAEVVVTDPEMGEGLPFCAYLDGPDISSKHKQHREEVHDVGMLLATAGEPMIRLVVDDTPDVHVDRYGDDRIDGNWCYVEHARIVVPRSAELDAALQRLNADLAALAKNNEIEADLVNVALRVGIRYDVEADAFPKPTTILGELRIFITSPCFASAPTDVRVKFPAECPQMHRFGLAYVKKTISGPGTIVAERFDTYDDARILANVFKVRIAKKIVRSRAYTRSPLCLALYIKDNAGFPEFTLNELDHKALEFHPFEALFIGDEHGLIRFDCRAR